MPADLKLIAAGIAVAFIAGAGTMFFVFRSGQSTAPETHQADPGDHLRAQQKLQSMIQSKQSRQAAEEARRAEAQRQAAEAAKPRYSAARTGRARQVKQWANVTIPEYNINGWLKTWWIDGNLHLRLALLGDREALSVFTTTWPKLRLTFADQGGVNIYEAVVSSNDLSSDTGPRNAGMPTLALESTIDCPLELYENSVQWNLKWEQ